MRARHVLPSVLGLLLLVPAAGARKPKAPPLARPTYAVAGVTVQRPAGEGWLEAPAAPGTVVLVRDGASDPGAHEGDSWSAQVLTMPAIGVADAAGMTSWLQREYLGGLDASGRFERRRWAPAPAPEFGPSCVRYEIDSLDRATGLELDERGIACDGASGSTFVKVSWRGTGAAPATLGPALDAWAAPFRKAEPPR